MRVVDLAGQKFGKLRVIERAGTLRGVRWKCLCDPELGGCGKITYVCSGDFRRSRPVRSCGCDRGGNGRFRATRVIPITVDDASMALEVRDNGDGFVVLKVGNINVIVRVDRLSAALKKVSRPSKRGRRLGEPRATHNQTGTPEYAAWINMRRRCYYSKDNAFHRYGGRGIRVHPAWRDSFDAFFEHVGPRPSPQHSLDRINNDGNYEPGNVRWATKRQQSQNHSGVKLSASDVAFVRHWASKGFLGSDISKVFGVNKGTIYGILKGKNWT